MIAKQGTNQIVIELPAVHDSDQAAKIIGQTAQLELYDLTPSLLGPSIDATQNAGRRTRASSTCSSLVQKGRRARPRAYYLFNSRTKRLIAGPDQTLTELKHDPLVIALKPQKPQRRSR